MCTITKLGQMVLKGVNWVHNDKIRSYGLERSNFCTQCKKIRKLSFVHFHENARISHLICIKCAHFQKMCENV